MEEIIAVLSVALGMGLAVGLSALGMHMVLGVMPGKTATKDQGRLSTDP